MKLITILCLFLIMACEKETKKENPVDLKSNQTLSFNPDSTTIHWVAYKLTSKVGVKGVFKNFTISNVQSGTNPAELFTEATFSIDMKSINTGVELRDKKLVKYFFSELEDSATLTGKLLSLDSKGNGKMSYTMNNKTSEIDVKGSLENGVFTLSGTLDLLAHNAQKAIDRLNEACKALHTGDDGVTKMWPDVDFKIVTKL